MLQLRYAPLLVALLGIVLSGCRTYGGYDTKPKTYQALQTAVQSFEEEMGRAEADLQMLRAAAEEADTLHALAEQYETLLSEHQALLEDQRQRLNQLSASASYRALHTAYGATVTEQRMQQQKYRRATKRVRATVQGPAVAQAPAPDKLRKYMIRPVNFPRLQDRPSLTMAQALQGR